MKPETRARISTVATASKRPEYSSHWMMRLASGSDTDTGMACGGPPCANPSAGINTNAAARANRRRIDKVRTPPAPHCCAAKGHVVALRRPVNRDEAIVALAKQTGWCPEALR